MMPRGNAQLVNIPGDCVTGPRCNPTRSPFPPLTRPVKAKLVSLSGPATTALDWHSTHALHSGSKRQRGAVFAKGTRTLLIEGEKEKGGEKASAASSPCSLNLPTRTKDSDRVTHVKGPRLRSFKCIWIKQQQFCEEELEYWVRGGVRDVTDNRWTHWVTASYCKPSILAIQPTACGQFLLNFFFYLVLFPSSACSTNLLSEIGVGGRFAFQHHFVLWINHIPHTAVLTRGLFLAPLLQH